MTPPPVDRLRLVTRAPGPWPKPPFGLRAWDDAAGAALVVLEANGADLDDPAQVAAQIPLVHELPPGTPLFVLGSALQSRALMKWIGMRSVPVGRAARCTALVARGFVGVGAAVDEATGADVAWGFSSPC